jgi:hypothetical protein
MIWKKLLIGLLIVSLVSPVRADEPGMDELLPIKYAEFTTVNWLDYSKNNMEFKDNSLTSTVEYIMYSALFDPILIHVELKVEEGMYYNIVSGSYNGIPFSLSSSNTVPLSSYKVDNLAPEVGYPAVPSSWEAYRLIGVYAGSAGAELSLSSDDFSPEACAFGFLEPYSVAFNVERAGFHPLCGGGDPVTSTSTSTTTEGTDTKVEVTGGVGGVGDTTALAFPSVFALMSLVLVIMIRKKSRC